MNLGIRLRDGLRSYSMLSQRRWMRRPQTETPLIMAGRRAARHAYNEITPIPKSKQVNGLASSRTDRSPKRLVRWRWRFPIDVPNNNSADTLEAIQPVFSVRLARMADEGWLMADG